MKEVQYMGTCKKLEIDKHFVLNCRNHFPEEALDDLTTAIICGYVQEGQHGKAVPIGTPCIVMKDFQDWMEEEGSSSKIIITFPPRNGFIPQSLSVISKTLTKAKDIKSPVEFLNVKAIDAFDADKLDRLINYIHDVGGISFTLKENEKRGKETFDFIRKIASKLFFSFDIQHKISRQGEYVESAHEGDELISLVSFFDLKSIIPVVDTRKLNGIGLIIEHFLQKHSDLRGMKEVSDIQYIIFSDYKENILYADGTVMNTYDPLTGSSLERLKTLLNRKAMNKATNKKRKQESGGTMAEIRKMNKSEETNYYAMADTSSTTTYTFTTTSGG
jgi:hypothetical protein